MKNLVLLSVGILSAWTALAKATYCVIDLMNEEKYSVTYLDSAPSEGFCTGDEYKTSKLVLKRVEPGSFIMGEDQTDTSHRVTLTKPFFMGIFEVTQKQWEFVMNSNPSSTKGTTLPVERVLYNMIRGSLDNVSETSFLGRIRRRTGLELDLPTDAQWEYACRAGTKTTYSFGDEANGDYMWYDVSSDFQPHEVGTKKPNPWGFYDMHGNVWEWCLDPIGELPMDPTIWTSEDLIANTRVLRGGSCYVSAEQCASSFQYCGYVMTANGANINHNASLDYMNVDRKLCGFRLVCPVLDTESVTSVKPSVENDATATVSGDAERGFTVKPSAANRNVYLEIPDGLDAAKVTVEVEPTVRTVTPNGAALRVVRGKSDITDYLDIPAAVGGVIVLSAATVKAEYANEPLDTAKGAVIDLASAESPSLTTAPTRSGLVYQLKEGATLPAMAADADGDQTIGDGAAWSPNLTVKGGASGFYTIKVEK